MSIKKHLKNLYYHFKGRRSNYNNTELCGKQLRTLQGTIRKKEDQDDAWWFYLSKHHDVIFDIGSNIGYTAILALIQNPNKPILLVDPNPKALQMAAMNLIENGLGAKAQFMTAFVSDSNDETVKFYTIGSGAAGSMHASHAETAASLNASIDVKTVTLDYLYSFYGLQPDLIKIDVEGAETLVMNAAKKVASATGCAFFIEMHNVKDLGMEAAGKHMLDWSFEMNYNVWYLKTGELLASPEKIKNRGKCHLLLLPIDKTYPDYLKGIRQNAPLPKSI